MERQINIHADANGITFAVKYAHLHSAERSGGGGVVVWSAMNEL